MFSPDPTSGNGGGHVLADGVGQRCACPANSASSSSRSDTDPTTSPAITGGSADTTGICDTAVLAHDLDGVPHGLVGMRVHQRRQVAALGREHLGRRWPRRRASTKPYDAIQPSEKIFER